MQAPGPGVTRDEVTAARRRYETLRKTFAEQTEPESYLQFPSGGDPKIEVFNLMSKLLEERNVMFSEAQRQGELQAMHRIENNRVRRK